MLLIHKAVDSAWRDTKARTSRLCHLGFLCRKFQLQSAGRPDAIQLSFSSIQCGVGDSCWLVASAKDVKGPLMHWPFCFALNMISMSRNYWSAVFLQKPDGFMAAFTGPSEIRAKLISVCRSHRKTRPYLECYVAFFFSSE